MRSSPAADRAYGALEHRLVELLDHLGVLLNVERPALGLEGHSCTCQPRARSDPRGCHRGRPRGARADCASSSSSSHVRRGGLLAAEARRCSTPRARARIGTHGRATATSRDIEARGADAAPRVPLGRCALGRDATSDGGRSQRITDVALQDGLGSMQVSWRRGGRRRAAPRRFSRADPADWHKNLDDRRRRRGQRWLELRARTPRWAAVPTAAPRIGRSRGFFRERGVG